MENELAEKFRGNEMAQEAAAIAAKCVQCGQCTVNCPTFRILNDDWDSPRGRVSLIRQTLEGEPPGADVQAHLDRCLTCRSCEAMCPEGVRFASSTSPSTRRCPICCAPSTTKKPTR